jgi:hypothetical protein
MYLSRYFFKTFKEVPAEAELKSHRLLLRGGYVKRVSAGVYSYLPHGPQPGITEASIGKKETNELAVMVDTFYPLHLTKQALELEKKEYMASWREGNGE